MVKQILKSIVVFILTLEARIVLWKYRPTIIAVTGSVGKTTVKDAIVFALSKSFFVRGSAKSFNSELGVPLTVLGCESGGWESVRAWLSIIGEGLALIAFQNHYPKVLVVEVGTDKPGDIARITRWLKPNVAVVTRVGDVPVHVEFFSSRSELIAEKGNIVGALKANGIAVLSADDPDVISMRTRAPYAKIFTYSMTGSADVTGSDADLFYSKEGVPMGVECVATYAGENAPLIIKGTANFSALHGALAACAVAIVLGAPFQETVRAFESFTVPKGRSRLIEGIRGSIIIDDTYNASPAAVAAALDALGRIDTGGRKIAILGDMLELGKHSVEAHKKMGVHASEVADILITVGLRSEVAGAEAELCGMYKEDVHHFTDSVAAGEFLKMVVKDHDVVLVKGSQRVRMERIVERIMAHPEQKHNLLVRQEEAWQDR